MLWWWEVQVEYRLYSDAVKQKVPRSRKDRHPLCIILEGLYCQPANNCEQEHVTYLSPDFLNLELEKVNINYPAVSHLSLNTTY